MKDLKTIIISSFFIIAIAFPQWSTDPASPQSLGSGIQAQLAPTPDGGCYVAWLGDGNNYPIYLQRLNSVGEPQWSDGGIIVSNNVNASWIAVYHLNLAVDSEGNAIITTVDQRSGGDWEVYAYKIAPNNSMLWGDDGLALTANSVSNISPRLAVLPDNSVVVTWMHDNNTVLFQRISSSGVLLWDTGILIEDNDATLLSPQPAVTVGDDVLIQWIRQSGPFWAANSELYLQKYDLDGNPIWNNPIVAAGPVVFPMGNWLQQSIADAESGSFSAWTEMSGSVQNARVQHINGDGMLSWTGGVDLSTNSSNFHISPRLTIAGETQEIMAIWKEKNESQSQIGIYAQRLDSGGNRIWNATGIPVVGLNSSYDYLDLSIAGFENDMIAVYIQQSVNLNGDIYAARLDANGNSVWMDGSLPVTNSNSPKSDMVAAKGPGCLFIAWTENGSVYAHCLLGNGTFGSPGNTLLVPSEYQTIQDAIDSASDGDMVLVASGNYDEHINYNGKKISIIGESRETTIIDANGARYGVVIDSSALLKSFTIQNASGGNNFDGGGIKMLGNATLDNLIVQNNQASGDGYGSGFGGGVIASGSGILKNSILRNNSGPDDYGELCVDNGTTNFYDDTLTVENCLINSSFNSILFKYGTPRMIMKNCTATGSAKILSGYASINNSIIFSNNNDPINQEYENLIITYSNITNGYEGEGNINVDPLFCNFLNGDYTLAQNSPCIGTGENGSNMGAFGIGCAPVNLKLYVATIGSDSTGSGTETSPFASIQFGLNTANEGDTVLVASGTYVENITWPETNGIKLVGSDAANCIIDGDSSGIVIAFSDSLGGIIDSTTLITGFTIQHGSADDYDQAGGLLCRNASPKFTNSIVKDNFNGAGRGNGGGIAILDSSSMIIENVTIIGNIAKSQYFVPGPGGPRYRGKGGGIYISGSDPTLINVLITNNFADELGGGVSLNSSSPSFINCTISDNISLNSGGGISCAGRLDGQFIGGEISNNSTDYDGGGIHIGTPGPVDSSQLYFTNVDIFNNHAWAGGGISIWDPIIITMAGCTIKENTAKREGGGIAISNIGGIHGEIIFSSTNRCNIYSNTIQYEEHGSRGLGLDIHLDEDVMLNVIVDTFSVLTPTDYYTSPIENFTFDIINAIHGNLINSDIYVSNNGDNTNVGTSPGSAFKTIEHALSRIYVDSLNINTIHLAPGIYSPDTNGEDYPLVWARFVNLSGSGEEETVLRADNLFERIMIFHDVSDIIVDSLTIQYGAGVRFSNSSPIINNVTFANNFADNGGAVYCNDNASPVFNNVTFKNNFAEFDEDSSHLGLSGVGGAVYIGDDSNPSPSFNYCSFLNNHSSGSGGAVYVHYGTPDFNYCLFANNKSESDGASIFIGNSPEDTIIINNSTFYDNQSSDSVGVNISTNSIYDIVIINSSIMWNNLPDEFSHNDSLDIIFSNIEGGFEGEGNINIDPLFCNPDSIDFNLTEESPCIGAGQYGVNMGAFGVGCNETLSSSSNLIPSKFVLYQNYPNPFNPNTNIRYDLPNNDLVNFTIYDLMGRVVKTMQNSQQNAGYKTIQWNATNDAGTPVSAGIYLYMIQAGELRQTKKMILIK